jgi:hypothetical protein
MIRNKLRLCLSHAPLAFAIWACGVASAADGWPPSSHSARVATTPTPPSEPVDAPPKPPQEAFDACKSLAEGDACSVSFNGHTVNGTCRKGPNGETELVCAPAHPPGPPPEAVEACKGAAEGAACSMTMRDGQTLTGTCRKDPGGGDVIACAPPHYAGPPATGTNSTMSAGALERKLDQLERDIHNS